MSLVFILFVFQFICQFVCQFVNNNLSYSLSWSGYTSYSNFSNLNNGSFLPIREASPFTIQINQSYSNIYLSYISIIFRRPMNNMKYLIFDGRLSPILIDRSDSTIMLKSHCSLIVNLKKRRIRNLIKKLVIIHKRGMKKNKIDF